MRIYLKTFVAVLAWLVACTACSDGGEARAEGGKTMTSAAVVKKMQKGEGVVVNGAHISGDLCFADAGGGLRLMPMSSVAVGGEVVFVNCVFEGRVSAKRTTNDGRQMVAASFGADVSFVGCTFLSDVDFSQSSFLGRMVMEKCVCRERVSVDGSVFLGGADLSGTSFWGPFSASAATFGPRSSFMNVEWRQDSMWQWARLECDAVFANSSFGGFVSMSSVRANGLLDFAFCHFGGRVEFRGSFLLGNTNMAGATFADLLTLDRVVALGDLEVGDAQFSKDVRLTGCSLVRKPDFGRAQMSEGAKLTVSEK